MVGEEWPVTMLHNQFYLRSQSILQPTALKTEAAAVLIVFAFRNHRYQVNKTSIVPILLIPTTITT